MSARHYNACAELSPDQVVAVGAGGVKRFADLRRDVHALAALLPPAAPESQATRSCQGSIPAFGPSRKNRSTTSSEIRSQTLSGCPSDTDSLVNKYDLRTFAFPSDGWMAVTVNGGGR